MTKREEEGPLRPEPPGSAEPPGQAEPPGHAEPPEGAGQLDWFRQRPQRPHPAPADADPVRTVWHLPRFRLGTRRFTGRIDHALVCVTREGTYETFPSPRRPPSVRRYVALYEVDTDPHAFQLNVPLPSLVDSFEFEATAEVSWRVTDPGLFVAGQERDVPGLIARRLLPVLRAAARRHRIDESAAAERAVQREADAAHTIGEEQGLRVSFAVRLRRDAAERSHQARLRTARHELDAAGPEYAAARLRDELAARRRTETLTFYEDHLARGGVAALALHLTHHPDDTALVLAHLSSEQAALVKNQLHLIDQAVQGDQLEGYELEEPHNLMVERMTAILRTASPVDRTPAPERSETPARLPAEKHGKQLGTSP
ncbi:hypothetical protein [Streptomyces similanensis]|uniref:PE-PGRS family protein n=1 Tax=Streptomyces similanensis TaxID=1274988 RepID=A0ABP9L1S7_9ACTN